MPVSAMTSVNVLQETALPEYDLRWVRMKGRTPGIGRLMSYRGVRREVKKVLQKCKPAEVKPPKSELMFDLSGAVSVEAELTRHQGTNGPSEILQPSIAMTIWGY